MTLTHHACMVRECRELEEEFGTGFTDDIISGKGCVRKEIKRVLHRKDRMRQLARCREKAPL